MAEGTAAEYPTINFASIFGTKDAYRRFATEFYPCHSHPLNLMLHVIGAGIQMWGAVQMLFIFNLQFIVYAFAFYVAVSTPVMTATIHTALFCFFVDTTLPFGYILPSDWNPILGCVLAFGCGFLKDVGHHICNEEPYMGTYLKDKPCMFFFHATWHLPFLIDAYSPFSTVGTTKKSV